MCDVNFLKLSTLAKGLVNFSNIYTKTRGYRVCYVIYKQVLSNDIVCPKQHNIIPWENACIYRSTNSILRLLSLYCHIGMTSEQWNSVPNVVQYHSTKKKNKSIHHKTNSINFLLYVLSFMLPFKWNLKSNHFNCLSYGFRCSKTNVSNNVSH